MKSTHSTRGLIKAVLGIFILATLPALAAGAAESGTDAGFILAGPVVLEFSETLKTGMTTDQVHRSGTVSTDDPDSPWYESSYLAHGSIIRDENGKAICEVMLIETTDADGDATWAIMKWWYDEGPGRNVFFGGTGKWKGITGYGKNLGRLRHRADNKTMWKIDRAHKLP